ncbi:putative membrane protein [Microbacterium sp. SORGH_AS428]|uniref:TMEM175 family protein n=1 Tax=Microbacterium sp. SORGH_AS_0428 TaxID=3041788 RepID=UPI002863ECB9|nr:TMEM175 family protein [Microbacterium sp. SORGH_AS_0428]MDR6199223.1 putative membrane protein [Microbacterium sp. SORGH_AS_0428]
MIRRRQHPEATVSTRRLEAYTDGVFAIAATLLVLDLTARTFEGVRSDADLWAALVGMSQPFFTFLVSFLILSLMWRAHVEQFEHISRIDALGTWINAARLFFIVLVPFTSTINNEFSDLVLGRMMLPINFFLAIGCSWAQWAWAMRTHERSMPGLGLGEARAQGGGALSALIISAGVVALSPLAGSLAFLLFLLDGPLTRLLSRSRTTAEGGPPPKDDTAAA